MKVLLITALLSFSTIAADSMTPSDIMVESAKSKDNLKASMVGICKDTGRPVQCKLLMGEAVDKIFQLGTLHGKASAIKAE
jgi:hypothetical protein